MQQSLVKQPSDRQIVDFHDEPNNLKWMAEETQGEESSVVGLRCLVESVKLLARNWKANNKEGLI